MAEKEHTEKVARQPALVEHWGPDQCGSYCWPRFRWAVVWRAGCLFLNNRREMKSALHAHPGARVVNLGLPFTVLR